MDPLAEKYYDISPYAWCGNNPIRNIDPDGRDPKKLHDWIAFGKSVYKATTAVITVGFQGSAKANVGSVAVGVESNAGSFDLIGVRDGTFTPNKNTPTTQSGGEISIGIVTLSAKTTITDTGTSTVKTETSSAGISVIEGAHEKTTEVDKKTNKVISTETQSNLKASDIGVKAGFIVGGELKVDMKKVEEALKKLIHE